MATIWDMPKQDDTGLGELATLVHGPLSAGTKWLAFDPAAEGGDGYARKAPMPNSFGTRLVRTSRHTAVAHSKTVPSVSPCPVGAVPVVLPEVAVGRMYEDIVFSMRHEAT